MARKYRYKVRVSPYMTILVMSPSATAAKIRAWEDIKGAYTYGYHSRKSFMKGVTASRG